jgi:hypothetical protein
VTVSVNGAARTLTVPATGSFRTWQTAALAGVTLNAGRNTVRVDTGTAASFNFDYMEFVAGGTVQPPTTVITTPTTTASSGSATFVAAPTTARKGQAVKFTVTPKAGKTIKSAWWSVRREGPPQDLEFALGQPDVLLPGRRHLHPAREGHLHRRFDRDGRPRSSAVPDVRPGPVPSIRRVSPGGLGSRG